MSSWAQVVAQVQDRANGRCEYCQMHESLQGATYHAEHIRSRSLDGASVLENLAWACPSCNLCKGNRLQLRDSESNQDVRMFDPRHDVWTQHLQFVGLEIVGLTPVSRALIAAFDLNSEKRLRIRRVEQLFGLFPPPPPVGIPD